VIRCKSLFANTDPVTGLHIAVRKRCARYEIVLYILCSIILLYSIISIWCTDRQVDRQTDSQKGKPCKCVIFLIKTANNVLRDEYNSNAIYTAVSKSVLCNIII